jgi:hypothetical protein
MPGSPRLFRLVVAALTIAPIVPSGASEAVPIFSQTPIVDEAYVSDHSAVPVHFGADDLLLLNADTARSIFWRGVYVQTDTPALADNFTIEFYEDNGGLPGGLLDAFAVNDPNRTSVGTFGVSTVYSYSADLQDAGIALAAGVRYWVSIRNSTFSDVDDWAWAFATAGGDVALGSPYLKSSGHTAYFTLDNSTLDGTVIPEPGSLALLGMGLAILARRRLKP